MPRGEGRAVEGPGMKRAAGERRSSPRMRRVAALLRKTKSKVTLEREF